jgi:Putative transposase
VCVQSQGFNLQAATRVAIHDKAGRERLCRCILRPPLADDRLSVLHDGNVRLEFKRPWSDGTSLVEMPPLALIARLATLVPPPKRHTVRYFGVLSSHASSRSQVVPHPPPPAVAEVDTDKPKRRFRYIRWSELLRRVFGIEVVCIKCKAPLRLISLIKNEPIAKKILVAMHLPSDAPELCPARGPPEEHRESRDGEDYLN